MNDSVKSFDVQAKLKRAVRFAAHALYPTQCASCGTVMPIDRIFCDECAKDIRPLQPNLCSRCLNPPSRCECDTLTPEYERAFAPFCYAATIRNALLSLKDEKNGDLARYFAESICNCIMSSGDDIAFDCVIPVPMHRKRKRERGFNQSELIAKNVADILGIPLDTQTLTQIKPSKTQHLLSPAERRDNVAGVYKATACDYKIVLLIDDIITTGCTANSCAKALKSAGVGQVYCAAVAKA
ncbi:MAG: ComF family protein [Acutalibacteraceae bacterium]